MNINLYRECSVITNQVPKGMVTTYGALAVALGDMRARRAVGVMMNTYTPEYMMPCHRVVYAGGKLGGFAYGSEEKIKRLAPEGVRVRDGEIVDFENIYFTDFKVAEPRALEQGREEQHKLAKKVRVKDTDALPEIVLALDVSYSGMRAFGAGALYDLAKRKLLDIIRVEKKIDFPYVPTYLAYREMPVFKEIIEKVDEEVIVSADGNGTLHPFGLGIASHLGVDLERPSIGVAKGKLCGEVSDPPNNQGESSPVTLEGRTIGHSLKTSARAKPIFVSPGHMVSMETSINMVKALSITKIPEPLKIAHMEATMMRRSGS